MSRETRLAAATEVMILTLLYAFYNDDKHYQCLLILKYFNLVGQPNNVIHFEYDSQGFTPLCPAGHFFPVHDIALETEGECL